MGVQNIEFGCELMCFGLIDWQEFCCRVEVLWKEFDVNVDIDVECGDFGFGEQKIVDIFKVLVINFCILIFDEFMVMLMFGESKWLFVFFDWL